MKIFILLFCLSATACQAQTIQEYEAAMTRFQQYYNAGQGDSIHLMFNDTSGTFMNGRHMWNDIDITSTLEKYGQLNSFKFLGIDTTDPNRVYVFQTEFSKKGTNMTSLTLYENQKLGTFRFITILDDPKGLKRYAKN